MLVERRVPPRKHKLLASPRGATATAGAGEQNSLNGLVVVVVLLKEQPKSSDSSLVLDRMIGQGQLLLEKVFQLLLMSGNKLLSSQRLAGVDISNLALATRHLDRPLVDDLMLPGLKLRVERSHQNAIDVIPGWGACLEACLKHAHDLVGKPCINFDWQ